MTTVIKEFCVLPTILETHDFEIEVYKHCLGIFKITITDVCKTQGAFQDFQKYQTV